jgi:hypothetical protein
MAAGGPGMFDIARASITGRLARARVGNVTCCGVNIGIAGSSHLHSVIRNLGRAIRLAVSAMMQR